MTLTTFHLNIPQEQLRGDRDVVAEENPPVFPEHRIVIEYSFTLNSIYLCIY